MLGENMQFAGGWYEKLGEGFADSHKQLQKFPSLPALAKSYVHLERMKGIPAVDADEDVQEAYRKAAGLPEDATKYITKPETLPEGIEWDQETADKVGALFHKHYGSPALANEMLSLHMEMQVRMIEQAKAMEVQKQAELKESLEKEWGRDFDTKIDNAVKVAQTLGLDMDDPNIGDNLPLIKALATISDKLSESTIKGAGKGDGVKIGDFTGDKAKAKDIMNNPDNPDYKAFHDASHPRHKDVNKMVDAYYFASSQKR